MRMTTGTGAKGWRDLALDDVGVAETGGNVERRQTALVDFVDIAAPAERW